MTRRSGWPLAGSAVVCVLATRAVWLAWHYYFNNGPRYRLESAVIALVIVGAAIVLLRPGSLRVEPVEPSKPVSAVWFPVFLIAAGCLYGPALLVGFLSDDFTLRAMAQSDGLGAGSGWFFRPVPLLVWRALLSISDSAVPLHVANVLLHGLNAFLVALLGSALGLRREVALGGAALFLTFPAAPEAVVWAAGIQDVLMTTMALGAAVVAHRAGASGSRIAVVCVMVAIGLGSKETAVCIPALIAICWMTRSVFRRGGWQLYAALVVVMGAYLAIRIPMGVGDGYLAAPSRYFVKQVIVIAFGTLATPWRAPAALTEQWLAFVAVVLLVLLLVHAFFSWRRSDVRLHRHVRLACWVLAAVGPVFTFFFVGPQLEGSRYLYLAECGWALLVADLVSGVTDRMSRRSLGFACAIGAAVVVSAWSVEREIGVWRRAAVLREHVLAEARTAMGRQGCVGANFTNVPDSVDGAYVFRNGFREALNLGNEGSVSPDCDLMWRDDRFVPRRP